MFHCFIRRSRVSAQHVQPLLGSAADRSGWLPRSRVSASPRKNWACVFHSIKYIICKCIPRFHSRPSRMASQIPCQWLAYDNLNINHKPCTESFQNAEGLGLAYTRPKHTQVPQQSKPDGLSDSATEPCLTIQLYTRSLLPSTGNPRKNPKPKALI